MDRHEIPPPLGPFPGAGGRSFFRRAMDAKMRSCLRRVLADLAKYLPDAFDHDRTCPYCVAAAHDPLEARLVKMDLKRLGFRGAEDSDVVVLLCPGCGFEEEG